MKESMLQTLIKKDSPQAHHSIGNDATSTQHQLNLTLVCTQTNTAKHIFFITEFVVNIHFLGSWNIIQYV